MTSLLVDASLEKLLAAPEAQPTVRQVAELQILRHVPGRRATAVGQRDEQAVVLKVFASPRARGNARRLQLLTEAGLADLVPTSLEVSPSGHVGLLSFRDGRVLDSVPDHEFADACASAGRALAQLHACGAALDRAWTFTDEIQQLARRAPDAIAPLVHQEIAHPPTTPGDAADLVPSHRDFHPRQVVITDDHQACLIDLDDCALAPPGLDVGNMVAHLRREAVASRRPITLCQEAREAFLAGYGNLPPDLLTWERLALVRLAGLAESRHRDLAERDALLALLQALPTVGRASHAVPADEPPGVINPGHTDRLVRVERRATGEEVVVKRYAQANGAEIHEQMCDLWASGLGRDRRPTPGMPKPLDFDARTGDLTMSRVAGRALATRGSLGDSLAGAPEAATLLADLHRSGVIIDRRRDRAALLRSTRRKAAERNSGPAGPHFLKAVDAIALAWTSANSREANLVPSHGDFSPRNILVGPQGPALIDFDRLQMSEPERDVAYWTAWLWTTATLLPDPPSNPWSLGDGFVESYAHTVGRSEDDLRAGLPIHQAVALVRIAHGWSSLRHDATALRRILEEALRLIGTQLLLT